MSLVILSLLLSSTLALGNTLNVTVLGAQHNHSTLECWALDSGFKTSSEAGTVGTKSLDLGDLGGDSQYTILPAGFNGGRHNAPALQYVPATPLPLAFQIHTLCLHFYNNFGAALTAYQMGDLPFRLGTYHSAQLYSRGVGLRWEKRCHSRAGYL